MTSGAPWSVKGIDPKAREVAKDLARRSGMTLGEWLNQVILHDEGPEEVTSESFFSERAPRAAAPAPVDRPIERPVERAVERPAPRFEVPEHPADYIERMAGLLERLTSRIETAEARTGQAVSGVEQSVRSALARIEEAERAQASVAGRVEGVAEHALAVQSAQTTLSERLGKMEQFASGPRSSDALRALEGAISKIAGQVYDGDAHTKELLAEVESRIAKIESGDGESVLIDQVVNRLGERLAEAEGRTADALEGLRRSFAALDGRLNSVEEGVAPAIEQKLEALAAQLTGRLDEARAEIAEKLQAGADDRFDRMERTFEEMSEHVRGAEERSAKAIEQMGREVLNVAEVLNRRVQIAETRNAEAIVQVGGEVKRIAEVMDTRLGRSDSLHAEALEKLSGEISRITEKLSERISSAERRSAQALDGVGEQVARVSERINARADEASGELADRIRQSEERTARLLEEARERIDQRLAETQTAAPPVPQAVAEVEVPPVADIEAASAFPAREESAPLSDDPFAGFPAVEEGDEPPQTASAFMERAFPSAADTLTKPSDDAVEIDVFEAPAPAEAAEAPEAPDVFDTPFTDASPTAEAEVEPTFDAPTADDEFLTDEPDTDLAAFADTDAESVSDDDLFAPAMDADVARDEDGPARPLSTREVVEQARAAARAAAQNGDAKSKKTRLGAAAAGKPSPLFSGFGLSRPKRRAGGGLQTFLLVSGGAAFLGLAAGGIALMNGQPEGDTPQRVADAANAGSALTGQPRASVALAPQSTAALGDSGDMRLLESDSSGPDLEALYSQAVRSLEAGEADGLDALKKAANLGHAPAQLYLGKVFEEGRFGVKVDLAEARRWTERAAEGGDRRAMHNVALYYFNGEGGPKNSTTAAQWFRRAADLGLVDSQYNLARLYEEGLGVGQNAAEAYKWFLIGARSGDAESRTGALRVRDGLSSEARAVAERTAVGFRAAAPSTTNQAAIDGTVMGAQAALSKLGYYQGPTNGEATPALRLAVAAYQRDQGMIATGNLDKTTVSRLNVFTR